MNTSLVISKPSRLGLLVQIVVILCLIPVGLTLGALTGVIVLSPIMGMALPLLVATWFLRRDGLGWKEVGFAKPMPLSRFLVMTAAAVLSAYLLVILLLGPLVEAAGLPPQDLSSLKVLIEGNTVYFLMFLLPVSWGSAAFGEELLVRGFLLNRLECAAQSPAIAVVGQAAIFALAHTYQGVTGALMVFVVGLVFGVVFLRSERNLWPVIVAHGIIDTIAITSIYLGADWV